MIPGIWQEIAEAVSATRGVAFHPSDAVTLGGGCINRAVKLSDGRCSYFVKTNESDSLHMFEAECEGLRELAAVDALRVPAPVVAGRADGVAFLVLEYVPMFPLTGRGWSRLGEGLAALHSSTVSDFGWHRDNTIGSTPQINDRTTNWVSFWREQRLGYQLRLARRNGLAGSVVRQGERLMENLDLLFRDYEPRASLLHGDLWGGNAAADEYGDPVLFDPAVYYGDREADIAMTELFGRFDRRFYEAYESVQGLESGYSMRKTLYNLYHVLNHFNLFGGGYGGQAGGMIDMLLHAAG